MSKFDGNPFNPACYIAVYQDAASVRPYGMRWKALFVTAPGDLTGQPVRDRRGDEVEFRSMRDAVAFLVREHGAERGDIIRTYLPRYEGLEGFYALPDSAYPAFA